MSDLKLVISIWYVIYFQQPFKIGTNYVHFSKWGNKDADITKDIQNDTIK